MKYCLFLMMIFYGSGLSKGSFYYKSDEPLIPVVLSSQKDPFYFINPVPAKIKLPDKVDLSFFRNQLIVFQYRYRIEIPKGAQTTIDRKLTGWSAWNNSDLTPIIVPRLDQEGGYKLVIEYKTHGSSETKRFEKLFYVYQVYHVTSPIAANYISPPKTDKTAPGTSPVTIAAATKKNNEKAIIKTVNPVSATDNSIKGKRKLNDKDLDLSNVRIKVDLVPKIVPHAGNLPVDSSSKPVEVEKNIAPDYDSLLAEAITRRDILQFNGLIQVGAGTTLKGKNGGNIFHLLDRTFVSEDMISMLKNNGFSINETDNNGNSPLHLAILSGENEYTRSLINQGAYLNILNNMMLSPLHLAVFLRNEEAVYDLIRSGADINLKGNTGYTPLHIASEMNYFEISKNLLYNGAKSGIKTDQKLSSKVIARIQHNFDIVKLISNKDSININPPNSSFPKNSMVINSEKQIPEIDFNLPFDKELAKKRHFNKIVQIISFPVFVFSAAGAVFLKSEANHYYSLSKTAETEDLAKYYYDKTQRYDKNAYISGGISLISLYGFIHTTIRTKSISGKMLKTFN